MAPPIVSDAGPKLDGFFRIFDAVFERLKAGGCAPSERFMLVVNGLGFIQSLLV